MSQRYDIRINKSFINANNDCEWFASDIQHIEDTLQTSQGSYKENPQDGVNVSQFFMATTQTDYVARLTMVELQKDKYRCDQPIVKIDTSGVMKIDPNIQQ